MSVEIDLKPKDTLKWFIVMVGLPGSGKSTMAKKLAHEFPNTSILSTDAIIESRAIQQRKCYNDVFKEEIASATKLVQQNMDFYLKNGNSVIVDQTNLSASKRKMLLSKVPKNYITMVFEVWTQEETRQARMNARIGKTIPPYVDAEMQQRYESPNGDENFDLFIKQQT